MRSNALDVDILHDRMVALGEVWADADAAFRAYDDLTKTMLSKAMAEYEGESVAAAETKARRSDEYVSHLNTLAEARRNANKARVAYDAAKLYVEVWRTNQATERAAMGMR